MKTDVWETLYQEARRVQNARVVSPFIEAGGLRLHLLRKLEISMSEYVLIQPARLECAQNEMRLQI